MDETEKDQEISRLKAENARLEWELSYLGQRYEALIVQRARRNKTSEDV